MLLEDYDAAVCLIVDRRYRVDKPRLDAMFGHLTNFRYFVDGDGKLLSRKLYDQTTLFDMPASFHQGQGVWQHGHAFRAIVKMAKAEGWKSFLFIEDDVVLTPSFDEIVASATIEMEGLPPWDILYYGANHGEAVTTDVSPHVMRVEGSYCMHLMGFRESVYDALLEYPIYHGTDWSICKHIHPHFRCYALWPSVARQKQGWSQLWQREVSYDPLFDCKGRNR